MAWRRDRILAFLNPYADRQGTGFHIIQSLIAVGTGGITGTGLMEGKQKLFYLPEPHTDFIFAVTAEELGLVGAIFVVALFAIFLWRGMRASWQTEDTFGRYLAVGITTMVVLQAFINISVVLGMMPTKGIPLAAGVVRRVVAVCDACLRGRAVEHHQASRVIAGDRYRFHIFSISISQNIQSIGFIWFEYLGPRAKYWKQTTCT